MWWKGHVPTNATALLKNITTPKKTTPAAATQGTCDPAHSNVDRQIYM